jgi:hypothetical protein
VHQRGERVAICGDLEIEAHLVLVAVERGERRRRDAAEVLAAGRVDLHHASPEVLEHQASERAGQELGGVDHQHPVERERGLSSLARLRSLRSGADGGRGE